MRYIIFALMMFLSTQVLAGGLMLEQAIRDTPEMSARCIKNIGYYQDKISKYELKLHLSAGQKIKVHYYKSELDSWQGYCYGDAADPDFN